MRRRLRETYRTQGWSGQLAQLRMKYGATGCTAVTLAEGPMQAAGGGAFSKAADPLRRSFHTQLTEEGAAMRSRGDGAEGELRLSWAGAEKGCGHCQRRIALEQTDHKRCTDRKLAPPPPPPCPEKAIWLTRSF